MVRRILRTMFAARAYRPSGADGRPIDYAAHAPRSRRRVAEQRHRAAAERAATCCRSRRTAQAIAVIGGHADVGRAVGRRLVAGDPGGRRRPAIAARRRGRRRPWLDVDLPSVAAARGDPRRSRPAPRSRSTTAATARARPRPPDADVAIVFATQWTREAEDLPDLRCRTARTR